MFILESGLHLNSWVVCYNKAAGVYFTGHTASTVSAHKYNIQVAHLYVYSVLNVFWK